MEEPPHDTSDATPEPGVGVSVARPPGPAPLLTGDLGVIAVRALLECGVSYVISSWHERPTPIDAAIDEARARLLTPRGIVLRRLRAASALAASVQAPASSWVVDEHAGIPRGAVVFAGRRGLRPTLEQFVRLDVPGGVVGLCYDEEALRIADGVVLDPEPTAAGLVAAIDSAFEVSVRIGRPALVLVRESMLGMRGTVRLRPERTPREAAARDAAAPRGMTVEDAVVVCGVQRAYVGAESSALDDATPAPERCVLLAVGPHARAAERALDVVGAQGSELGSAAARVSLITTGAGGVLPLAGDSGPMLRSAAEVCVVAEPGTPLVARLAELAPAARVRVVTVRAELARVDDIRPAIADWLRVVLGGDPADDNHAEAGSGAALPGLAPAVVERLPRRDAVLHRAVSPALAAALSLAQGVIGVPGRIDPSFPSYRTDGGVSLTIVPADVFAAHGVAAAAPEARAAGVFVITGAAAASGSVTAAASACGATIEHVDSASPRAVAACIARACRTPRSALHVVAVHDVPRVAAPTAAVTGIDHELHGTERLATAAAPREATILVELGDELTSGPAELLDGSPAATAALPGVRELTPATWDLYVRRGAASSRMSDGIWKLRRRLVHLVGGVDL